jgi:hypothetical protein
LRPLLGCMARPWRGREKVSQSRQGPGFVTVENGTDARYSIHAIRHEPRRGSVMQPQGAEPSASAPWGQHEIHTHDPGPQRGPVSRAREVETVSWAEEPRRNLVEVRRRMRARGVRVPGEHSPRLGTPGLHDATPVGSGESVAKSSEAWGRDRVEGFRGCLGAKGLFLTLQPLLREWRRRRA